jgi:hypothetical protein
MKKTLLALALAIFAAPLPLAPLVLPDALTEPFVSAACAASPPGTNRVAIGNFSVAYPDGWSTIQSGSLTMILNVPAGQQAAPGNQFVFTPQVSISTEQRLDHSDALKQLDEIAAGAGASLTRLTVGGAPAVQWRKTVPWPQARGQVPVSGSALTINTAIAAGSQLIRLYGSLPSDASPAIADTIVAIETSVTFSPGASGPAGKHPSALVSWGRGLARVVMERARDFGRVLTSAFWLMPNPAMADDAEGDLAPPVSEGSDSASQPSAPGVATRILQGTAASEPEVAVSANGRNIVVAQQFVWTWSNNGGLTFTFGGTFPNSTGGDSSLAVGATGNFYEGTIFNNTTAIHRSTNGGQTFTFRGTAFTCGALPQCNFTGGQIPDQEHIAADRVNQVNNQDQVYNVFRNGSANPTWGITCSTDGGANWSAGNVGIAGDFPRITVGQDGFVYVAFEDTSNNLRIAKFASCNTNAALPVLAGWPQTVAAGVAELPCPIPGLDRCTSGNTMRSPTVVVDDTNANHVFYAYASNTAAGNENILVRDSTDGGTTWSAATTLNGGGTARRYMPWMCATRGTAYVTWYDRRSATAAGATNDLTDYFGASATRSGANLNAGAEFQLNDPATADAQCLAGQPAGSQRSWPGGSRATTDSTSCSASEQPQLAGVCGTGACGAGNTCPAGQTCDGTGICRIGAQQFCDFNTVVCTNAGDSCRLWGGGTPKYGDYNGNACAQGHLYAVWASATPARAVNPGIDLFFKVRDTVQPIALCKNVTVPTDLNKCTTAVASVDNGSNDPDFDTVTISQAPLGPYPLGATGVTLTIADQNAQTNSCTATVIVVDQQKPSISCPSPVIECASPSGAAATLAPVVSDNCPGVTSACVPPSGSTFALGTTPFTCTATDASTNQNSCNSVVKVQDTTPPVISSVSASPNTLWPPNHKFVPVQVSVSVKDICDPHPSCVVASIASNEPPLGGGSGNTSPDFEITGPLTVNLRAERDGTRDGRIYTLTVKCTDASNNSSQATTTVSVVHDQGK